MNGTGSCFAGVACVAFVVKDGTDTLLSASTESCEGGMAEADDCAGVDDHGKERRALLLGFGAGVAGFESGPAAADKEDLPADAGRTIKL